MGQPMRIVDTLLTHSRTMEMSARELARTIGVAPGTISGWRYGASPGSRALCEAGLALGWRLEVRPQDPTYPGAQDPLSPLRPEPCEWWNSYCFDWMAPSTTDTDYLLALVGAEIHWARSVIAGHSRYHYAYNNRGQTWALVERGPSAREEATMRRVEEAAACFGLELCWELAAAPWRVRPWQLNDALPYPPRRRSH